VIARRRRTGFTFVTFVTFLGTLALVVAMVQTDAALTAMRRAARACAHVRARAAAASLAASLPPGGQASVTLPGASATAAPGHLEATALYRGRPLALTLPR